MKYERIVRQMVDVDAIRVRVPIEHDSVANEEIPDGMPGVDDDRLTLVLGFADRKVRDWPAGIVASVHLKVRDEGRYELLAGDVVVAARDDDYVPSVMPGEHFGDYVMLDIQADGTVKGWWPDGRTLGDEFSSC